MTVFTIYFTAAITQVGRVQSLITAFASQTHFMKGLANRLDLFCCVCSLATSCTFWVSSSKILEFVAHEFCDLRQLGLVCGTLFVAGDA